MKRIKKTLFFAVLLVLLFPYSFISVKTVQAAETLGTPKMVSVTESGTNRAVIKWQKVTGASGYRIYRKVSGQKWAVLNTISNANTTVYTDSGLKAKTRYFYTVRAYKRTNAGVVWSDYETYGVSLIAGFNSVYVWKGTEAQLKAYKPSVYPLQEMGKNGFLVKWKMLSGADGYRVYRKTEGGKWETVKTLTGGSNYYYEDKGLTTGVQYFYTVAAYKRLNGKIVWSSFQNAGVGQYAGASIIKALKSSTPKVSVSDNGKKNVIKWNAVKGADGYNIYRKENGQSWKKIKAVSGAAISYADSNVISGKIYFYTVRAYMKAGSAVQWSGYNKNGVSVMANKSNIKINPDYLILKKGEMGTLALAETSEKTVWSSSNTKVITVDQKGAYKAAGAGTAVITADLNGVKFTCNVNVWIAGSKVLKGIDVSFWNIITDFSKVKKEVDFMILREGYGTTVDSKFIQYASGAKANGIPVHGVYHFCYATNEKEVIEEAKSCIANLKKAGLGRDTIVFFDFEYDTVDKAADKGIQLGKTECTNFAVKFCDYIESQGYRAGVYYNLDYKMRMYDMPRITRYVHWMAYYHDTVPYPCQYHQYSSKGEINGMIGDVDMNYCFASYFK